MPDESATTSPGAIDENALLMGKIRPPEGLLSALRQIRNGAYQQYAVLIIFSKDIKGRLGVAGNRIITGASLEPSRTTGLVAANQILAVDHGMYGFRASLGNEKEELSQNLDIDIDTLLNRAGLGTAPGAESDTDTTLDRAFPAIPKGDVATEDNEVDKSYLHWLRSEKDKVFADIERSMDKARNAPMPASADEIVAASRAQEAENDLRLVSEMLQSEQHRAQHGWQGLDDIPTPSSVNPVAAAQQVERRSGASNGPASRKISTASAMKTSGRYRAPNMASSEYAAAPQVETDASRDQKLRTELADYSRRRQIRIGIAVVAVVFACGYMNYWMTSKDVDHCFAEAKTLFAKKDYKGTIFLMQQALTKDANNPRLHMQKALAHARLGESDEAIKEFDAALKSGGPRLPALVARATVFCDKEEFDKAIAECQAILLHYPKSVETYSILATAYERQSQQEQAVKAATEGLAVATDPADKARLLLQRGFSYGRMREPAKAEADLTEAIKLKESPATYMARGDIYKKLRKYPEAVVDYSLVIRAQPDNYNAYVARGIAEMKAGRDEEAIADFAHALCINKSGVEAMIQRGSLYLSRGAYQLAINDLADAVRLNPRIAESQQKLDAAQKHLRTSTPHLVLKLDERATKFKMPSDPNEIMKVGRKFLDEGEIDHAVLCFKAVVKKQPNNAEGRRLLAQTLYEGGDSAGAASQFEALNSLAGIDPNDVLPMAQSLSRSGRRDRAIQVLETWVGVAPQVVPYRYELANLHFADHNAGRAKEVILAGIRSANSDDRNKLQSLLSSFQAPAAGKRSVCPTEKQAGME